MDEYLFPLFNYGPYLHVAWMKHDDSVPSEDVTVEYMLEHLWLVGSPDTVAQKIRNLYETSGGFGVLLVMVCWITPTTRTAGRGRCAC